MLDYLIDDASTKTTPIRPLSGDIGKRWLETRPDATRRWINANGFSARPGTHCVIPNAESEIAEVLFVPASAGSPWDWSHLPSSLPKGNYRLESNPDGGFLLAESAAEEAVLGWALGTYRFQELREGTESTFASLAWPEAARRMRVEAAIRSTFLVRDLINSPASHMGPEQLATSAKTLADEHGASQQVLLGDDLLEKGYPAIHAVGRAAAPDRAPRLINIQWGKPSDPKVTLVGKGVCFDSGGLDLKSANNMKLMKKDMGGAAHVLGLAGMIMAASLPVRLRVLVPAVENSVSSSALRPLDVIPTRKGSTIEIGNTDAEGRVILSDALWEASSESPELIIDFATLTGAGRVALGAELPAMFSNDQSTAEALLNCATAESDFLWRLPLWQPYRKLIEGKVADITNSADSPLGGCITAALFLAEFVDPEIPWVHIDLGAWNMSSRPGRPEGGEAMGMRAAYALIEQTYR